MKKLLTIVFASFVVFALATPVSADDSSKDTQKIKQGKSKKTKKASTKKTGTAQ